MLRGDRQSFGQEKLEDIRRQIYHAKGYYNFAGFIDNELARSISRRWNQSDLDYYFDDAHKNAEVNFTTPNYLIETGGREDKSYCMNSWMQPVDEQLYEIIVEANKIRNLIEGRMLYFGLSMADPLVLQYRFCRTISSGVAVKWHADFFEEHRQDPTGSHAFDPVRCQATLFMSDTGIDYRGGGFYFEDNTGSVVLFGHDRPIKAGDLLIWKYSNKHSVKGVEPLATGLGFSRVIMPLFDNPMMQGLRA